MDAHRRWNFLNGKKRNESTPILYHLFMHFCIFALESPIMSASRLAYVCVCLSTWQLQLHKTITNVRDKVNYTSLSNLEKTYGHLKSSKLFTFLTPKKGTHVQKISMDCGISWNRNPRFADASFYRFVKLSDQISLVQKTHAVLCPLACFYICFWIYYRRYCRAIWLIEGLCPEGIMSGEFQPSHVFNRCNAIFWAWHNVPRWLLHRSWDKFFFSSIVFCSIVLYKC